MKNLTKHFLSYSLLYFALKMWRGHFEFLPQIENNHLLIETLIFSITCMLFSVNLKIDDQVKSNVYAQFSLVFVLVISYSIYWNLYAFVMRPHVVYFPFSVSYLISYLIIGLVAALLTIFVKKIITRFYEKYRYRA